MTTTSYDADSHPVGITYSDATPTVSYGYDPNGDIASITDATGTRALSYDADGDLTKEAGPGTGSFSYSYNSDGYITSRTYPDGTKLSYTYNTAGQVASMTDASDGSAKTTYTYGAAGQLTSTVMPDGVTETRGYDDAGHLTSITDTNASTTLDAYSLTLNADGQPSTAATTQDGTTQPPWYYTYDADGRLASACQTSTAPSTCSTAAGGEETAWTYDTAGNRLTKTFSGSETSYTYNAAEQLTTAVTGTSTVSYGYDSDGNLTTAGTDTYAYNGASQLDKAVTSAGTDTYTYDASGNLSATSHNGTLQQTTLWDLSNPLPQVAEQTSPAGATTADLVYNPNGALATMTTSAGTYQATTNWLGSVTGLVNSSGAQVSSATYAPYGAATATGTPVSPIGFAGSYALPGSDGLQDMNARDYKPATATFASVDPLLNITGQPYAYANDSPAYETDPTGLCSWYNLYCSVVQPLIPEYGNFCIGGSAIAAVEACIAVGRDGSLYFGLGVGLSTPGFIASTNAGYIAGTVNNCQLDQYLSGSTFTLYGGDGFGMGGVWGNPFKTGPGNTGYEAGLTTPGIMLMYTYSWGV